MEWLRSIDIDAKSLALLEAAKEEESRFFKMRMPERRGELEKQMVEWAEGRLAHIDGGGEVTKMKEGSYTILNLGFWPRVHDPQRALTLFKLMYWIVLFDDVVDDSAGLRQQSHQVARFASALLHAIFGHPLDEEDMFIMSSPRERLLVQVGLEWWGDIQRDPLFSATQLKHFETQVSEYVLSQAPFTRLNELMEANKPPSIKEYMPLRIVSGAIPLCYAGIEFELPIELDNETRNHPLVKQLQAAVANHIAGLNDFFSFPKELLKGDFLNLLPLLHIHNNTLAQQASQPLVPFHVSISQAWEMINTNESECARLASLILTSPLLASNPSIKPYVEDLCGFNPTIREFSRSARYKNVLRASCSLLSFAHEHTRNPSLKKVTKNNPHYLQLKGIQCLIRGLPKKDHSFPLMPNFPSSMMNFGGCLR